MSAPMTARQAERERVWAEANAAWDAGEDYDWPTGVVPPGTTWAAWQDVSDAFRALWAEAAREAGRLVGKVLR